MAKGGTIMKRIPKNRQDSEMFIGLKEQVSFENTMEEEASQEVIKSLKNETKKSPYAEFFSQELKEEIGKALLTLKLELYKDGISEYSLKVFCEKEQIVLRPVPNKRAPKK